jgi:RsiW-degrading membrane proteinase PrsW (M82 family)
MNTLWQVFLLPTSLVCAIVPMVLFLWLVWWMDRYDREPIWLVMLTFAWGALGGVLFALIGSEIAMQPISMAIGATTADQLSAVLVAPLVEEPTKAMILFIIMFSRYFDHAADGFVYGAAAGLGFGMTENFLYFTNATGDPLSWAALVVIRTFFSAVMHGCASSCVGAVLGWARFRGWFAKIFALPLGFGPAMGMHALWNGLLTLDAFWPEAHLSFWNFVVFPFEVLFLFGIFQFAIWDERAIIRRELADEVQHGLLPLAHASAIAGYFSRKRGSWVPAGVPHEQYVRAATTLALRKHQCRHGSSRSNAFYQEDVMRLRKEIQELLKLAKR